MTPLALPTQPPTKDTVKLVIEMDAAGNVSLNGPIENRMICYGLLEVARDMIHEMYTKKLGKKIALAPAGVLRRPGN